MVENLIQVGSLITLNSKNDKYRIISLYGKNVILCKSNSSKLEIVQLSKENLIGLFMDNECFIEKDE